MSAENVLVQMAQAASPPPVAPDAMLARALLRACDQGAGLDVTVKSVQHAILPYAEAMALAAPSDLLCELNRSGRLVGMLSLSAELRAGLVEMVAAGRVSPQPADDRPPSGTDLAVAMRALQLFFVGAQANAPGTQIAGWLDDIAPGARLGSTRVLDLTLDDETMATIQIEVSLGDTGRTGALRLILPDPGRADPPPQDADWIALWGPVARSLPVRLDARLHQMVMGLSDIQALQEGVLIPLVGADVAAVQLVDGAGSCVARGRLGQMGGKRAVRLSETLTMPGTMEELGGLLPQASIAGEAEWGGQGADDITIDMPGDAALPDDGEAMSDVAIEVGGFDTSDDPMALPEDLDANELTDPLDATEPSYEMPQIDLDFAEEGAADQISLPDAEDADPAMPLANEEQAFDLEASAMPDFADLEGEQATPDEEVEIALPIGDDPGSDEDPQMGEAFPTIDLDDLG